MTGAYPTRPELGEARHGWSSTFPVFRAARASEVVARLAAFIGDPSAEQMTAWRDSIPPLQGEIGEVMARERRADGYEAILEYELPLEFRRPDAILLAGGSVFVLEMKGKAGASQADVDQAAGYARDLRAYHRECERRPVHPLLVLTRASGRVGERSGVHVVGMDAVDDLVEELNGVATPDPVRPEAFLAADAYRPLPSLVEAARELFASRSLRRIHRAATATEPAMEALTSIIREAAEKGERRLVLVTGLPGAGKTLVGLQIAHASFLDDLAVERADGKPTAPAVFLSGNGPLVTVLQYELKAAGGGGKAFVRGVKQYVDEYTRYPDAAPPEHVLVFDEAQRAFSAEKVARVHGGNPDRRSEPEHFVDFAQRVPGWCVVVGLIGGGQEIHEGEEAGIGLWRLAVEEATRHGRWVVHAPGSASDVFDGYPDFRPDDRLHLGSELRFHVATRLHEFVSGLIGERPDVDLPAIATGLEAAGYHLRITRDLDRAKRYLRSRYADDPLARFGLVASSRDRDLARFGVPNDWHATQRVQFGPWYALGEDDPRSRSCRELRDCVTEFGAQGLELDAVLLAWGTDFVLRDGRWITAGMRGYARGSLVEDPFRLRVNAYRVLLTRGRDATVIYVPPIPALDETHEHLVAAGFLSLDQTKANPAGVAHEVGARSVGGPQPDDAAAEVGAGRPPDLDALLAQAASASPSDRIEYRDLIAGYGDAAVEALRPWLADATMAGFAVRVIGRAASLGSKSAAVRELRSSLETALPDPVRRDVQAELERLGAPAHRPLVSGRKNAAGSVDAPTLLADLVVGKLYRRRDLHVQGLGGNWQKGISYPAHGDYALLFSDPARASDYGYRDSWLGHDGYRYFGEWNGTGDMTMTGGNAVICDRSPELYLFTQVGGARRYEGRFRCTAVAPERAARDGREHTALVFTLERDPPK